MAVEREQLAAVVLCGGRSRRMGRDKSLLRRSPDDPPLVLEIADRLAAIADPVLIAPGVSGRLGPLGYPEVNDATPDGGPLAGIVAALGASPRGLLAVVGVDMPFISLGLLASLAAGCGGHDAAVPLVDGSLEPLHAVYSRRALPKLATSLTGGQLALRVALEHLDVRAVPPAEWPAADADGGFALNLNLPADVERWRRGR